MSKTLLSSLESILFSFIEQIRLGAPEIYNLRATVSIFLLDRAFLAVVSVRDSGSAADHATALVRAVIALVAYSHQGAGSHVRIADHAFPVAFLAQSSDGDSRLFSAKYQIRMMLCHCCLKFLLNCI